MATTVSMSMAHLNDPHELARFLAAIPNGDGLGKVLVDRPVVASRAYDDDANTARFVASDGEWVKCFAVTEITIDQAEMIAAVGVDIVKLDLPSFQEIVVLALGPSIDAADG